MTRPKRLTRRQRADIDVLDIIDHYLVEAPRAAIGLVDALEAAYQHIARAPAAGSPRYAHELNLPGHRCWRCARYPYPVFYMEHEDRIDVWRVFHSSRDMPVYLQDDGGLQSSDG